MKRIAATFVVAAAIAGIAPAGASAAPTTDLCNAKAPVLQQLLIPFCE